MKNFPKLDKILKTTHQISKLALVVVQRNWEPANYQPTRGGSTHKK